MVAVQDTKIVKGLPKTFSVHSYMGGGMGNRSVEDGHYCVESGQWPPAGRAAKAAKRVIF